VGTAQERLSHPKKTGCSYKCPDVLPIAPAPACLCEYPDLARAIGSLSSFHIISPCRGPLSTKQSASCWPFRGWAGVGPYHRADCAEKLGDKRGQRCLCRESPGAGGIAAAARTVIASAADAIRWRCCPRNRGHRVVVQKRPFAPLNNSRPFPVWAFLISFSKPALLSEYKRLATSRRRKPTRRAVFGTKCRKHPEPSAELSDRGWIYFTIIPFRGELRRPNLLCCRARCRLGRQSNDPR